MARTLAADLPGHLASVCAGVIAAIAIAIAIAIGSSACQVGERPCEGDLRRRQIELLDNALEPAVHMQRERSQAFAPQRAALLYRYGRLRDAQSRQMLERRLLAYANRKRHGEPLAKRGQGLELVPAFCVG